MTITEFLEARITEDEAALDAVPVAAQQSDDFDFGGTDDYLRFTMGYGRAVAECAAKRAIIGMHETYASAVPESVGIAAVGARCGQEVTSDALRAIAAIYADHPDYDPYWAL